MKQIHSKHCRSFCLPPILRRREQQANMIDSNSDKIAEEERLRDQLPKLKKDYEILHGQIKKSQTELGRLLPKGKEQRAKRLLELEEACTQLEGRIESLNRRQKALDDLFAQITFYPGAIGTRPVFRDAVRILRNKTRHFGLGDFSDEIFRRC